jgi:ferredoxin-fold anticodon binding domain-containing protein
MTEIPDVYSNHVVVGVIECIRQQYRVLEEVPAPRRSRSPRDYRFGIMTFLHL